MGEKPLRDREVEACLQLEQDRKTLNQEKQDEQACEERVLSEKEVHEIARTP